MEKTKREATFEESHPGSGVGKIESQAPPGETFLKRADKQAPRLYEQAMGRTKRVTPSSQPSDFERGVLHAATFLRSKGTLGAHLAKELLETTPRDSEGTEARTSGRIADWLLENGVPLTPSLTVDLTSLAKDVRYGAWKLP